MAYPQNNRAFILLGSNQGDRAHYLLVAQDRVRITVGKILHASSIYETAAWGKSDQPGFLNQVIEVETGLPPEILLEALMKIETDLGRKRTVRWGPRILDLDILYYGNEVIETKTLSIPHPGIPKRRFTLVPLHEIAPGLRHPILNKTTSQLLEECEDPLDVRKLP